MFRAVIGSHKIYCYITLQPGRDFSPYFLHMHRLYDAAALPGSRQFARLARWQLMAVSKEETVRDRDSIDRDSIKSTSLEEVDK